MTSIHLYQQTKRAGRLKHLIIEASGNKLNTTWYTSGDGIDGAKQSTSETIVGVNTGKTNATSDEEQCLLEFERKVKLKKDDGYLEFGQEIKAIESIDIDPYKPLPKEFTPCKPKQKKPDDAIGLRYLTEQKINGECILLHNTSSEHIVYSRKIHQITDTITVIPDVNNKLQRMPPGTIVIGEARAINKFTGIEDKGKLRGYTSKSTTREKALARLEEDIKEGWEFTFYQYDIYYHKGTNVTNAPFSHRYSILEDLIPGRTLWQGLNEEMILEAKKLKWEGYILRDPNETIEFTMNGKPSRVGSHKFKFVDTDDAFVWGVEKGDARNENNYATFYLGQYIDGVFLDCGKAGPGKLKHKQIEEITKYFNKLGYTDQVEILDQDDWIVVELEYSGRTKPNEKKQICFNFPEITIFGREDKEVNECIYAE